MKNKDEVVGAVKHWTLWWVNSRRKKLEEQLSDTMAVNPFVLPFFFAYHGIENFEALADLIIASHLLIGHNTGFGKLIDEKILPHVFGTNKLSAEYRRNNPELIPACFNEIDHIIVRENGVKELMSLKAGRWTIQLTMAMQLNTAFNEIVTEHAHVGTKIVVGVFYGKGDDLTDKYDILRGINRGAQHNVIDLTHCVEVHSGRDFWEWLNDGAEDTQEWVLQGIIDGVNESGVRLVSEKLLKAYKDSVVEKYEKNVRDEDGSLNWFKLLKEING